MRGSSRSRWFGLTTAERNAEIVAARQRNEPVKAIARRVGISQEQVRLIVKQAKVRAAEHPLPPIERIACEEDE